MASLTRAADDDHSRSSWKPQENPDNYRPMPNFIEIDGTFATLLAHISSATCRG
jgi:hypothetical protein